MGKFIWKEPCPNCPSAHHEPDPEALQIERWYKNGEVGLEVAIFPCAWRPQKYCKGVCDKMGVVEKQISERQDLKDRLNPLSKVCHRSGSNNTCILNRELNIFYT